ncbi:MAG: glycosyltransferase family 39 protein [Syntrophorhabdaceae bacterium]|nr:glycosyltransferase family 39 protein [Syntrophorhabdaceae bacterium]
MKIKHILLLLIFSYIFLFHGIGSYSLKEPDEGRYAEIPREMVETGDFIVPHLNYVRYFEKPPLFYWAVALSYKCFGVSEWSFRFPNSFGAFICVLSLYFLLKRWIHERAAFFSALVLLSSFGFFAMARVVTLDMFFTTLLFLALIMFFGYYKEKKGVFLYSFYTFLALATLTKGFVTLILIGITILVFLITERRLSFIKETKPIIGIFIYLSLILPWFALISLKEKEFFDFFVIDQHILRFLTTKHKRTGSIFYFFPVLIGGMFPWSFFIPRSLSTMWHKQEIRYFSIWSIVIFFFFSISKSKLPPYILPIFPALSVVIGIFFSEIVEKKEKMVQETLLYIFTFMFFGAISLLGIKGVFNPWILMISDDSLNIIQELKPFLIETGFISFLAASYLLFLTFKSIRFGDTHKSPLFLVIFSFSFLFLLSLFSIFDTIDKINASKEIGLMVQQNKQKGDLIINFGSFNESLPFYTGERIIIVSYKGELEMGSKYPDARPFFIDEEAFQNMVKERKRVWIVSKKKRIERLKNILGEEYRLITCQNQNCLITNHNY